MRAAVATALLFGSSFPGWAEKALDLARYDCSLPTEDKTVRGDDLARQGYQIANRSRFGDVNVMMIDPRSSALVNCFKRQGEGR